MKKTNIYISMMLLLIGLGLLRAPIAIGQSIPNISGHLIDTEKNPIEFANVALYQSTDSTLTKVTTSNEKGLFEFHNINFGSYLHL